MVTDEMTHYQFALPKALKEAAKEKAKRLRVPLATIMTQYLNDWINEPDEIVIRGATQEDVKSSEGV